jgi:GWxTD domain-containing protein
MKTIIITLSLIFTLTLKAFPTPGIGAYLSHGTFNVPGEKPYVEVYLEIIGNTLVYEKLPSGLFQGSVQVTMIIKQDSVIKDFKKYELLSDQVADTNSVGINFIDQQRFTLPNGNYVLELSISDNKVDRKPQVLNYPFSIEFPNDKAAVSTVQLVNSYTKTNEANILSKSGYDLVPLVDNYYPSDKDKLIFYAEVYNPNHKEGSDEKYLISYYLESFENGRILNDFARTKKEDSRTVTVVLNEFDISRLPTGNYNVVISLRDKQNSEVAVGTTFFERSNPEMDNVPQDYTSVDLSNAFSASIMSIDTLREYIQSLSPIATEMEKLFINFQSKTAPLSALQQYFQKFWESRDPLKPKEAWLTYKDQVRKVNEAFSTQVKKGYNTDMGYVYLKYGEPNTIQDVPFDAGVMQGRGSVPYQIWHYYSLNNGRERNKRFVFVSSEVTTKDYTLVHSDARGEIQNYNWQGLIHREIWTDDADRESMRRDRSRSGTIYNNPY